MDDSWLARLTNPLSWSGSSWAELRCALGWCLRLYGVSPKEKTLEEFSRTRDSALKVKYHGQSKDTEHELRSALSTPMRRS